MIFGHEIVGRHYDAYTVIFQMATRPAGLPYLQPLTDLVGWLLARAINPVAAYNVVVLMTFPLTAVTTYALSRYLFASHAAALFSSLAFAFTPFHLAHSAYHPHIAQIQWIPLYLLALFAFVDRATWPRAIGLVLAAAALVLSNDYGGFIGAVMTPIAMLAHFFTRERRSAKSLAAAAALLAGLATMAAAAIWIAAPRIFASQSSFAFPRIDVEIYRARWFAYFLPPVDHALLGASSARAFARANVVDALVEEQLYIGFALLAFAAVATFISARRWRQEPRLRSVVSLLVIGIVAAFISLGPLSGSCAENSWAPSCILYGVAPMFRSYARFGVVTSLAVALAAGVGFAWLLRARHLADLKVRPTNVAMAGLTLALTICAVFEFWPLPWRAHDVLPTEAHRWLARQQGRTRTMDCITPTVPEGSVPWLMHHDLNFLNPMVPSCVDPQVATKLAALQYTHVLVRRDPRASVIPAEVEGLAVVKDFPDARVYFVTAEVPAVVTLQTTGFYENEHSGRDWWRWMDARGQWTVRNTTSAKLQTTVDTVLDTAGHPRMLTISVDGTPAGVVDVQTDMRQYVLGPWTLAPGDHTIAFAASGEPFRPTDDGKSTDTRRLTVAFRNMRWNVQ